MFYEPKKSMVALIHRLKQFLEANSAGQIKVRSQRPCFEIDKFSLYIYISGLVFPNTMLSFSVFLSPLEVFESF